jgi:HlyD family secretion protein
VFTGTVKFISPYGAKAGNVIKFAIQISLDPTDSQLRGGLNATANIMAASVKNALLVPVSVIINTPNGPMVTVVNEATGASERKRVTLGIQNFQFGEVLSGLKEGDNVRMASWQGTTTLPNTQSGPRTSNPMRVLR